MIYRFARRIITIALHIFFRKIVVTGKEHIPAKGPVLLIANHPNTLIDPLIVASITQQQIGFVANATIYSVKFLTPVFRYFHVIPIYRKKDVKPGEQPDNKAAFIKCHEYLSGEGSLLIFPEGSSLHELKLREIKTGTARIALSFEEEHDFEGGLTILPIALDYSDAIQFRSMVSVTVEKQIRVADYKELYLKNNEEGVRKLTADIQHILARYVPQTSGKEMEDFLIKAHRFYTAYAEPGADLYRNTRRSLEVRKKLSDVLQYIHTHQPELYEEAKQKVQLFYSRLDAAHITSGLLTDTFLQKNKVLVCAGYITTFVLLLPVYLIGLLTNGLPYMLPSGIFNLFNLEIEYRASAILGLGMVLYLTCYTAETLLFRHFITTEMVPTLLWMALMPLSGFAAMFYWTELKRFARVIRFYFNMNAGDKNELLQLRNELLAILHHHQPVV
ncbi:MAG TPA: 1-acyl-sn-glycerol-3-phosphate acyltransferase [Bacteroidia bacterium]|nr:1-acyl-sn-glycerol-3-phosphate acyltransferase [Bacteroidia bacterium]